MFSLCHLLVSLLHSLAHSVISSSSAFISACSYYRVGANGMGRNGIGMGQYQIIPVAAQYIIGQG